MRQFSGMHLARTRGPVSPCQSVSLSHHPRVYISLSILPSITLRHPMIGPFYLITLAQVLPKRPLVPLTLRVDMPSLPVVRACVRSSKDLSSMLLLTSLHARSLAVPRSLPVQLTLGVSAFLADASRLPRRVTRQGGPLSREQRQEGDVEWTRRAQTQPRHLRWSTVSCHGPHQH
ncbi:hypothetical protein BJV74DRAFT_849883, partial [Russula compacta]